MEPDTAAPVQHLPSHIVLTLRALLLWIFLQNHSRDIDIIYVRVYETTELGDAIVQLGIPNHPDWTKGDYSYCQTIFRYSIPRVLSVLGEPLKLACCVYVCECCVFSCVWVYRIWPQSIWMMHIAYASLWPAPLASHGCHVIERRGSSGKKVVPTRVAAVRVTAYCWCVCFVLQWTYGLRTLGLSCFLLFYPTQMSDRRADAWNR